MGMKLEGNAGYPLEKQLRSWKQIVKEPISKLDSNAFSRVRIILLNGLETEALRFSHAMSRMTHDKQMRQILAEVRRIEQHQATTINWLMPADQSALETTIAYEQVAIEVTAALAQREPDPYLAQTYRFGLLEDFDHMYRYSALMDRIEGKDANNILQSYTDILPGRPTRVEHRHPADDLKNPYDRSSTDPLTKLHALTLTAAEFQTHDYYMNVGPQFADPLARQLYAEIASIEEQHVSMYESLIDPNESYLEKLMLHEANEVYNYYSCVETETDSRLKRIWEMFLDFEINHLNIAMDMYKSVEGKDPMAIIPTMLPDPISFASQRPFIRQVLEKEIMLSAASDLFVNRSQENRRTVDYRNILNSSGSPSEQVAAGYQWSPGTELASKRYAV